MPKTGPEDPGPEDDPLLEELIDALEAPASPSPAGGGSGDPWEALRADISLAGHIREAGSGERAAHRERLGKYADLVPIGSGGFGVVYRARDSERGRVVALKVPSPDRPLTPEISRRFRREARAMAGLDHPNIIKLLDVGEDGPDFYLALDYCDGPNLAQWLQAGGGPLDPRRAARLASVLADALAHAHERQVFHRDIKPSNILMRPESGGDAGGLGFVPMITDFGLARIASESTDLTRSHAMIGTLPYMAPEQVMADGRAHGPTIDIYALGVTLYEAMTGRPPFQGDTPDIIYVQVIEADAASPRQSRPEIPHPLETICLKCLEKDPRWRYPAAEALRDDLDRFLAGRPIRGRLPALSRFRRWRRKRPVLGASLLYGAPAAASAAALAWGLAAWSSGGAVGQGGGASEAKRLLERSAAMEQLRLAGETLREGHTEEAQNILEEIPAILPGDEREGFVRAYLRREAGRHFTQVRGGGRGIDRVALSRDESVLAGGGAADRALILWDWPSGEIKDRAADPRLAFHAVAISGEGRWVAVNTAPASGNPQGVLLRDAEAGRWAGDWTFPGEGFVSFGFVAGDRVFAALFDPPGAPAGKLRLWDLAGAGGAPRPIAEVGGIEECAFGARRLIAKREGGLLEELDPLTGKSLGAFEGFPPQAGIATLSADERVLAAWEPDHALLAFDAVARKPLSRADFKGPVIGLSISPRGDRIVAAGPDGIARAWDLAAGGVRAIAADEGSDKAASRILAAFAGDGSRLATAGIREPATGMPVRLWEPATGWLVGAFPGRRVGVGSLRFADGDRSLLIAGGPTVLRWKLDGGGDAGQPSGHADEAWALAFSLDSRTLVSAGDDTDEPRTVKCWDVATGRLLRDWKAHAATVSAVAFRPPGGEVFATGSLDAEGGVAFWGLAGEGRGSWGEGLGGVRDLAFTPDGSALALGNSAGAIRLYDPDTGSLLRAFESSPKRIRDVCISPKGDLLAWASEDGFVRVRDLAGDRRFEPVRLQDEATTVAFVLGGAALAVGDRSGVVTILDPARGEEGGLRHLRGESGELLALACHPDGKTLAGAGMRTTIRFWDVETGQELMTLRGHAAQVNDLAFSLDGATLASCDHAGVVRIWRAGPLARPDR